MDNNQYKRKLEQMKEKIRACKVLVPKKVPVTIAAEVAASSYAEPDVQDSHHVSDSTHQRAIQTNYEESLKQNALQKALESSLDTQKEYQIQEHSDIAE